jgi:hypothetical protein
MRYWWVNQNQTYRHEVDGGYLWSPKRNANGARNPFYDSMREVSPGDIIFSFAETYVRAIGIAQSYCWESPKPAEFGTAGQNWENIGWRVAVEFHPLPEPMRPKDQMALLAPLLPERYAPLQANGNGLQSVYLTELSPEFAGALASLLGRQYRALHDAAQVVVPRPADDIEQWERKIENQVAANTALTETERKAIIRARRGQGIFRDRVSKIEHRCRITGVDNPVHLVASHCKPWRDATNDERLDGENGLLLTPSIDHLFDRGFISFEDNGRLLVSPVAQRESLRRMGVETQAAVNVGAFSQGQRRFLDFHRGSVFLKSSR